MSQGNHEGQDVESVLVWVAMSAGETKKVAVRAQHGLAKGWVEERMGDGEWQQPIAGKETYTTPSGDEGLVLLASIPDARVLVVDHPAGIER